MRAPHVLTIEDNSADANLLRLAFTDAGLRVRFEVVPTGHQAIARLEGAAPYEGSPIPDLVVLDLNLPGLHGHELLSMIRDDERLRDLRTVILTSSNDPEEAALCHARGADAFLIKPAGVIGYDRVVAALGGLLGGIGLAGV